MMKFCRFEMYKYLMIYAFLSAQLLDTEIYYVL